MLFTYQNLSDSVVFDSLDPQFQAVKVDHGGAAVLGNGAKPAEDHSAHRIIIFFLRQVDLEGFGQFFHTQAAADPPDSLVQLEYAAPGRTP